MDSKSELSELFHLLRNQNIQQKEILSFKEALIFLDVSKSFLYKLTSSSAISYTKPNNGRLYFLRTDLEEWMLKNKHKSIEVLEDEQLKYLNK